MRTTAELITQLQESTANNHHTESLILIAGYYDLKGLKSIFTSLSNIITAEGHLPFDLVEYRHRKYHELLDYVRANDKDNYDEIYQSL